MSNPHLDSSRFALPLVALAALLLGAGCESRWEPMEGWEGPTCGHATGCVLVFRDVDFLEPLLSFVATIVTWRALLNLPQLGFSVFYFS